MHDDQYFDNIKPMFGIVEEKIDGSYVKVRVFGIHPLDKTKVPTEDLPKALVFYPVTGGQVNGGSISHNLEVDAWVKGYILDYPACTHIIVDGVVNGTDLSMSTTNTNGGEFVGQGSSGSGDGSGTGSGSGDSSGSGSSGSTGPDTSTVNIPGNSNVQKVYNYIYAKLKAEGISGDIHVVTSGLVGTLMLESGPSINPAARNPKGGAFGICQWLDPRKKQLISRYGGLTTDLGKQLDFMWWEWNNTERTRKGPWTKSTNIPDAVAGAAMFERGEDYGPHATGPRYQLRRNHTNFQKKLKFAYKVYKDIKYTGN